MLSNQRSEFFIDTDSLAIQIPIYLKNYYCLPNQFQDKQQLDSLTNMLKQQFSAIIQRLSQNLEQYPDPKDYKNKFAEEATKVLHDIDQHLALGLVSQAQSVTYQNLLKKEGGSINLSSYSRVCLFSINFITTQVT